MVDYNTAIDALAITTYANKKKKWYDNMSTSNALLNYIKRSGKMTTEAGGTIIERAIQGPLSLSNYKRYEGYQLLDVNPTDGETAAQYNWRQAASSVTISGREIRINQESKTRLLNLVENKVSMAMNDIETRFNIDLLSDGTATNQILGLQALISDSGTGTVGGINSSTYTWWRNLVQSAAAPLDGSGAVTVSATTIEQLMRGLYNRLLRGKDKPTVILSDLNYYEYYEASIRDDQRFMQEDSANAGFQSLAFRKTPVVLENSTSAMPTNHMYFINTNYLELVTMKGADWEIGSDRSPVNQDAVVKPILWMGAMICTNRALQGVLKA